MHVNDSIAKIDKLTPEYEDYEDKTPMIISNIYHKRRRKTDQKPKRRGLSRTETNFAKRNAPSVPDFERSIA